MSSDHLARCTGPDGTVGCLHAITGELQPCGVLTGKGPHEGRPIGRTEPCGGGIPGVPGKAGPHDLRGGPAPCVNPRTGDPVPEGTCVSVVDCGLIEQLLLENPALADEVGPEPCRQGLARGGARRSPGVSTWVPVIVAAWWFFAGYKS